jgi:hypothetical protein
MPRQVLPTRPKPGKRKPGERRRAVRLIPPPEAICYWTHGSEEGRGRVHDISARGLCLVMSKQLAVGSQVAVDLINSPYTYRCARVLRVVRILQSNGKVAVIAGEFDRPLTYSELLPFFR